MQTLHPLSNIALSFSGGGYRAAAYNLGVLSYLHNLQFNNEPLLKRVAFISTISGGTITGVKYALCLAQKKAFDEFFFEMYEFLANDFIMDAAFKSLHNTGDWQDKTKTKNLINAFSEIYQKKLYNNDNFGFLIDHATPAGIEFMFNATDIENAKPFRFQTRGTIGNYDYYIIPELARKLRLGDIAAASSCFPGGFEPLIFPNDFFDMSSDDEIKNVIPNKINIMDGGIVDNQGFESIWLAEDRKTKGEGYFIGTYIICDVARKSEKNIESPQKSNRLLYYFGKLSLNGYYNLMILILVLSISSILFFSAKWILVVSSILLTISTIILISFSYITSWACQKLKETLNQKAPKFLNDFTIINKISLNQLYNLIAVRVSSVLKLNQTVFLARMRKLHYSSTYEDINWSFRTISSQIYDLPKIENELSSNLKEHVNNANKMDTTLWFSDSEQKDNRMLNDLIICGQATICQKLRTHLEKRLSDTKNPIEEAIIPDIKFVVEQLRVDFIKFNDNPSWLLDKYPHKLPPQ
jgi:predicted acylesterase/phospholipase RssA